MGAKLVSLYNNIKQSHGSIGLYRLIVRTRISFELAEELGDTNENITLVKKAVEDLGMKITASDVKYRRGLLRRLFRRN